jgi:hypothetical protein
MGASLMPIPPYIKKPSYISVPREKLIADLVIGGCTGSILTPVVVFMFQLEPGFSGIGLTLAGACIGALIYRFEDKSSQEIQVDQDIDDDVVYISLGKPAESYVEFIADDTICYRRSYDDDHPSGVTIMSFKIWRNRLPELSKVVARHLKVPQRVVESSLFTMMRLRP